MFDHIDCFYRYPQRLCKSHKHKHRIVSDRYVGADSSSVRYDGNEQFCGTLGKIQYVAIKHQVHFNFNLSAENANRQYLIDWQNNTVRGYTVGVFLTDHSGAIRKGSLRMYRAGEVRGIGLMIYYLDRFTPVGTQHFKPC